MGNYKLQRRKFLSFASLLPLFISNSSLRANDIYSIEKVLEPRYMGNVNAPIKFTEFVSFTCSHCADFHINKLPTLKEKYIDKGLLRLELRDFPLDGLALRAAAMSRLVDQNKYYKFVEMLFNKQKNWSQSNQPIKELRKLGRLAGLKKELLDASIDDLKLLEVIFKIRQQAEKKYNIQSTPSFVINDKYFLSGNLSLEKFEKTFNKIDI
tara:strand:- start:11 stop:640 length:630 start_codon:yes stop_codon:yes gene_type:complete